MDAISGFVLAPVGLTLILGSFLIFLLFWKYNKKYDCWKKMGVPYIKPYPILGSMLDIYGKLLHEVEVQRYKKYGSLYGHFVGAYTMLTVGDPEHLRNILVKDFHIFSNRRAFKTGGCDI
ncbi:cytochrome P450 3A21 [Caerostris extrusa]|uniref:Cytochrome P450 3A21 n=1 Tax=Caerostris extrusa TaxID=172846 RepID=A0AAV4XR60_CAEEX|nr:cytochrome P450 3A21 [Caerostris extrusa]